MDLHRRVGVHGLIAPNAFAVTLAPADVSRFANFIDALSRELSDAAREHARVEAYTFVGPVEVEIFESDSLKIGRFTVTAEVRESEDGGFLAELVLPDGRRVAVGSAPLVIGRLPECDVVLNDSNVSRRHAELRRSNDGVFLTDLGSTNGTRVNGAQVREQILVSGDEVSVGSAKLIFEMT
jgi:hypothetical protein